MRATGAPSWSPSAASVLASTKRCASVEQAAHECAVPLSVERDDSLEPQPAHEGVEALGERAAADDVVPDGNVARDVRDRPQRDCVPLLLDEPPDGDDAHRLARPQVPRPEGKLVGHDRHAQSHELLGWAAEGLERTACMLAVDGQDVRRLEQRVVHRRTVRARLSADVVAVERDDERRPGLRLRECEPPGVGAEVRVEHVVATGRERDRRHGVERVRRQRGIDVVRPLEQPRAGDLVVHGLARARAMVGDDVDHRGRHAGGLASRSAGTSR